MAQTTAAISSNDYTVWTSPDGTTFTDRSGYAVRIQPASGTRKSGQTNTFSGDIPITTSGKRDAQMVHIDYVYTEEAGGLFEVLRAAYEANTDLYIRYAPKGGQTTEFLLTTLVGKLTSLDYPQGDANSGEPVILGADLFVGAITKSVAP
ncbi:MAG: hypothetical protein ABI847_11495 [Anaerolineales bacterium]